MERSRYNVVLPGIPDEKYAVWYNTSTQALALVAREAAAADGSTPQALVREGFFVPDREAETDLLRQRFVRDQKTADKFCLEIAPTMDCNMACPYCYEREVKHPGVMSAEVQQAVARFIIEQRERLGASTVKIGWYGGEPLMGLAAIEGITRMLDESGIALEAAMISNCTLLTPEVAARLAACHVQSVMATLDGVGERHNAHRPAKSAAMPNYEAVVQGVRNLSAVGIRAMVMFNEDRGNSFDYENVKAAVRDIPGVYVEAGQIFDYCNCLDKVPDFTREKYDLFEDPREFALRQYTRRKPATWRDEDFAAFMAPIRLFCSRSADSYCVIDERGRIYECDGDIGYDDRVLGSVFDGAIPAHKPFNPFDDELCAECPYVPLCLGNCRWTRDYVGSACAPQKVIAREVFTDWIACFGSPTFDEEGVAVLRHATPPDFESDVPYNLW